MASTLAMAVRDISRGESGRRPFELLRNIVATGLLGTSSYADECLRLAIHSPWIPSYADFMSFIDILDVGQKIHLLNVIMSAVREVAPFKIRTWSETKATIDFMCIIIRRKANSSATSQLIGDVYKMRMKRQCTLSEMKYIAQMPEMEDRYAPPGQRYMDAIQCQNYAVALELWEEYHEITRNEIRNMHMNAYVHGMFKNHLLVWQEPLQSFTSYFEYDAGILYTYLEHVITVYGAPNMLNESIIHNLMHCTGKKDADRENAIVSAIIDKIQSSHEPQFNFFMSCTAAMSQLYMPFFRLFKQLQPTMINGLFKQLLIQHMYTLWTKKYIFSDAVIANIYAAWTELRQLFPALELPDDINCHLQSV